MFVDDEFLDIFVFFFIQVLWGVVNYSLWYASKKWVQSPSLGSLYIHSHPHRHGYSFLSVFWYDNIKKEVDFHT